MSESDFSRPAGTSAGSSGYPPSYPPQPTEGTTSTGPSSASTVGATGAPSHVGATGAGSHTGESGVAAQAGEVATHAGEAGKDLAREAQGRAGDLAHEAQERARTLMDQARSEVTEQASSTQQRLAGSLRSIGAELSQMGDASPDPGYATDLVRQGSHMASRLAGWFEDREPGDVVRDVQDYARRRPGMFLAIAAGAGMLAGRLMRGVKDASDRPSTGSRGMTGAGTYQPVTPAAAGSTTSGAYGATSSDPLGSAAAAGLGTSTGSPTSGVTGVPHRTTEGGAGYVSGS